jgi:hypothetical protein
MTILACMNRASFFLVIVVFIACTKSAPPSATETDTTFRISAVESPVIPAKVVIQQPVEADTVDHRDANFFPPGSTYVAISSVGTPLRVQPDSTAEILISIPHGTPLKVVQRMHYDTLIHTVSKQRVPGLWVKMRYENTEGFVFSGDVMSGTSSIENNEVHFFLTGEHCNANFQFKPNYHYYAVFRQEETYQLKKIIPAFYVRHEIPEGVDIWEWFHIETNIGGQPSFIFGIPKELSEQQIVSYEPKSYDQYSESDTPDPIHTSKYELRIIRERNDGGWKIPEITLVDKKGKRIQTFIGSQVYFCGDLDQDGIADLMYLDTNEKEGGYHLALSSYAEPGMLVRSVGYYQLGYCC